MGVNNPNFFVVSNLDFQVVCRKDGDSYTLFDGEQLEFYKLNDTSAFFLKLLSQEKSFEQCIKSATDIYDIDYQGAHDIFTNFLSTLPFKKGLNQAIKRLSLT
ncbi:PqqD family protein [Terrilactibacillus laevilacticus]|uniref:PqqD family protein n=1 Tax=Terrilactibacillus laevilacticus TaxID=1380157 RepID=UPI001146C966|nr:PqqD family protein [Terrilactibacillus laevilacticus]